MPVKTRLPKPPPKSARSRQPDAAQTKAAARLPAKPPRKKPAAQSKPTRPHPGRGSSALAERVRELEAELKKTARRLRLETKKREQIESELRLSEACFHRAFELGMIGMAITSVEKFWLDVNDRLCEIFGYPREELARKTWAEITHPEDLPADVAQFERVLAGAIDDYSMEKRFIRKDGSIIHAEIAAKCLRRADGSAEYFVAFVQDITAHKRALEALRNNKQRLQYALDATAEGVWDWNLRTDEVLFSRNWKTSLGYSPDEAPDRFEFWESIVHPEDMPRVRQALNEHFEGRTPVYRCENRLRMKSGEYRQNLDRGMVVEWDESGKPLRMVGTDSDITDIKKAQNDLLEANKRLEAIFNASHQAVFLIDTAGIVITANEELARRLDSRVADIIGKSIYGLLPDELADRRKQQVEEAVRTRQAIKFEDNRQDHIISQTVCPVLDAQGNVMQLAVYAEDVTDQRRSEQALRQSEEKYRLLFENSLDGIFITITDGTILDANPAACAMLGMSRDEVCRAGREGIVEHNATLTASLRERERTGSAQAELTFVRKDGSTFTGETSSVITTDQCGTNRTFVIVSDITERKRVEQALRESEERYRRMVETANEGIWSIDGNYRTTFVNQRMADMLGYAPEEMIGRGVDSFMFAEDLADHESQMAGRARGESGVYERRYRRPDGREIWAVVSATPLIDPQGNFAGSFGMFTDITDRRQAEEALQESEIRYRIVADNTYDWEYWAGPDGKFIYSSPSCLRTTGYSPGDFLKDPDLIREIIHPQDRATWDEHRRITPQDQKEFRIIRADGETRWIDHICQPVFDSFGKVLGWRASNRDVTERRLAEEALLQYENIVSSATDAMSLVGRDYVYKTVNNTYLRRTGLARDQIVGKPVSEVMGQAVFDEVIKPRIDQCLDGETVTYSEWFDFSAQGRRHVEVTYSPCWNRKQEVTGTVVIAHDITERKKAEETLARSEELLKRTQSLTKVGGWEWDLQTQTMSWTEECYRIHEMAPEEVAPGSAEHIARSLACYDEPDRPRILEAFRRCAEEGRGYDLEAPFTTANGRRLWVRTIAEAVWGGGKIAKVAGNLVDITERKLSEEVLQARLRLSEASGKIGMEELLRLALDEVERIAGSCMGFFHFFEEDQQALSLPTFSTNTLQKMCTVKGQGRHYGLNEAGVWAECIRERRPVIHNDFAALPHRKGTPLGHPPIIRELVVPILRDDRIVAVLGVANKPQDYDQRDVERAQSLANLTWDIVLRKRAEEQLDLQAMVLDQASDRICVTDLDGVISYINAAECRALQRSRSELIGRHVSVFGEDAEIGASQQEVVDRTLANGQWRGEVVNFASNGAQSVVDLRTFQVRNASGKAIALCGIGTDVTDRKAIEAKLQQSQGKLRELYRQLQNSREDERQRISRRIHDELGQNITALQVDIAWLKQKIESTQIQLHKKLESMRAVSESTLETVRRISAELRPAVLDALGLPSAVDWLLKDFQARSEIQCRLIIEPEEIEVPPNLSIDIFRILQEALTNVLRHAQASSVEVNLKQKETQLELHVIDNGIGIPEEKVSQAGSLGLLGIHERLRPYGGVLRISGAPGKGTSVIAAVPI